MLFSYEAKNEKGGTISGKIDAVDLKAANLTLKGQQLYVVKISAETKHGLELSFLRPKIPLKDKIVLTKQLSIMIRSGLSLIDALKSLETESPNKALQKIIGELVKEVEGGSAFSVALEKHRDVFGEIYVNMVRSGEESGKVDMVLERLAMQEEKDYEIQRKVKNALSYPIFILVTMVVVIALVIVLIIPQLKGIFDDAGVSLPLSTRIMISLSTFLRQNGIWLIIGAAAFCLAVMQWGKTKRGKLFFDKLVIKLPIVNIFLMKSYMARFTRTFASLVASGLPLIEVFQSAGKVMGNVVYESEIAAMSRKVEDGASLSSVFKASKLFPGMVGQLSAVGEKSGNIDEVFDSMADFFDKEVDNITSNISALLEPILMVVIGTCIGFVIMSVLQPIYGLVNAI